MLSHPQIGQRVELRYAPARRAVCRSGDGRALHGCFGTVLVAGRGRPRNHLIRLDDGREVIVPAGNLRKENE